MCCMQRAAGCTKNTSIRRGYGGRVCPTVVAGIEAARIEFLDQALPDRLGAGAEDHRGIGIDDVPVFLPDFPCKLLG